MSASIRDSAATCCDIGLKVTPLNGKRPTKPGWNLDENLFHTAEEVHAHWSKHPTDNFGVCLEPSGLVSIDCDDPESASLVLDAEGIDLDAQIATTPTIIGRAPRLEFRMPFTGMLTRKAVVYPPRAPGEKPVTVLEFRAGRVQDVFPPSIHPDTHQPYRWMTKLRDEFPPLPDALLRLWLDFDAFRFRARNLCPWADPEPAPIAPPPRSTQPHGGPSVIAQFNEAHDPVSILESHGYTRIGRTRWKSPNGHGGAGVVLLPSGKVFCHHQSDALGNGRAHDAFDLYTHFDHGGNFSNAVRAAARVLGIDHQQQ